MANSAPTIEIYLGAPPSEQSEREFVTRLQADLSQGESDAVVLANFNIGPKSLQIDLVVATETTACVVEVKSYQLPVTGDLNGTWRQKLPDGATRSLGEKNPYMQAMDARFAIIDAMVMSSGRTPARKLVRDHEDLLVAAGLSPVAGSHRSWATLWKASGR